MTVSPDKIVTPDTGEFPIDQLDKKPNNRGKIDIGEAFKLRLINHLSYDKIAKHFGVSKQAVYERLNKHIALLDDPQIAIAYEANKSRVLSGVEGNLLTALLDPQKVDNASLNNVAYAFTAVATQARLEAGKSTSNVSLRGTVDNLEALAMQAAEKLEKLKGT